MDNLDPQLLAQILALRQNGYGPRGPGQIGTIASLSGQEGTPLADWSLVDYGFGRQFGTGNGSSFEYDPSQDATFIAGKPTGGTWDVQRTPIYNTQGKFIGYNSGDGDNLGMAKFIAASLGGYYGAGALNGLEGAAAAGGTTAGTGSTLSASQQAAMMAANGMTDAEIAAAIGSQGAQAAGLTGVTGGAATGGGLASTLSQAGSGAKTLVDALGGAKGVATLAGGIAGALDSGDKKQSSDKDPWAPAQDFLKQQIAQGSQLSQQYAAQPFSQAQQTAYANAGNLLDLINANAAGLLAGPQANAMGANQFTRGQPMRLQGSTFNPSPLQWTPGRLGNFGTGR